METSAITAEEQLEVIRQCIMLMLGILERDMEDFNDAVSYHLKKVKDGTDRLDELNEDYDRVKATIR